MAANKGNQFWKLRSKHGRDKLFETPELLWDAACEYFSWCDQNPWIATKTNTTDKGVYREDKPVQRPYSKTGFFLYIGCSETWLTNFKKECEKDFLRVIEQIEQIIDTQQFEGATVGAFNANIISRKLGLTEKTDNKTEHSGTLTIKRKVIK